MTNQDRLPQYYSKRWRTVPLRLPAPRSRFFPTTVRGSYTLYGRDRNPVPECNVMAAAMFPVAEPRNGVKVFAASFAPGDMLNDGPQIDR